LRRDGSLAQVNRNGWAVALVTSSVRTGEHRLAYRLATALGLDMVHNRMKLVGSVNGEHCREGPAAEE
jgi:hypothetical protein